MKTYQETIDYLFASLPMFQRIGDAAIKKNLDNIMRLCEMLDHPQKNYPAIHVAGTNGKGSTSHMLAAIFQASGKRVGLYTSPHYVDFRERIKINGENIPEEDVIDFVNDHHLHWEGFHPSFFEITVVMAFDFFSRKNVDIAIIETGLGGRLDSTNIITPLLSVITNIGFDHMSMLGDTLPAIAAEKAGIIKPGIPVVIGEHHEETADVFIRKAHLENAPIHFASVLWKVDVLERNLYHQVFHAERTGPPCGLDSVKCDLQAAYQVQNICTIMEVVYQWNHLYPNMFLTENAIRDGLQNVKGLTGMMGRWMVIGENPLVITDAAHNEHGMMAILPSLLQIASTTRHFVLGFVSDKDVAKVLQHFPADGKYYWCAPAIPRRKPVEQVKEEGEKLGLQGNTYDSVEQAYEAANQQAIASDLIFVGGSSYVVGDFLASMHKKTDV